LGKKILRDLKLNRLRDMRERSLAFVTFIVSLSVCVVKRQLAERRVLEGSHVLAPGRGDERPPTANNYA
ncbi:MAG: hypothetical protein M3157_04000, partial [Actinomycetota bacterium]|nr:hypothetical protein [Actinomycetota bacterium]